MVLTIRPARDQDAEAVWRIIHEVLSAGDTYTYPPETSREEALGLWHAPGTSTFIAERGGDIVGTYFLKSNQPGQGRHVANCGYMVARSASGHGVGEAMCRHSLEEAKRLGFLAMQFNCVVSTNTRAVALWRRCGFEIVGTVPRAFCHPTRGMVDVFVMHRFL